MERVSLEELQVLLISALDYDYGKRALLGPMIYEMDDEYYNAAMLYVKENKKTPIKELFVTTEDVERELDCCYLEALCIVNNVKKYPDQVDYIMHYWEIR